MKRYYFIKLLAGTPTAARAINSFAEGDEQKMMLLGLKRFTKTAPFNSKDARRLIAAKLIADGKI